MALLLARTRKKKLILINTEIIEKSLEGIGIKHPSKKYDGKDLLLIGKVNVFSLFKKLNYAII